MIIHDLFESSQPCPECGGISFSDLILAEKKDACYYKVKASAKVWPSAYASGRLVQCRKKGADNYGNKSEGVAEGLNEFAQGNGGDDGESFDPDKAKMAYDHGFGKGVALADGSSLATAFKITRWDQVDGGLYKQHFVQGFKEGRMDKINHDNKQYNLNLKLMKDGSIRHGEQGVAEGSEMLSLDDKIKIYSKHKSQAQQAENRGDYTTADKHKKQASRIYSNIVNLHFGDDSKDAQNAANEYIRKSQGVAEAGDSNFVGFMNKTLADKVDAPKADPMAGAPDFYRNAAVSALDARRGFKNALKFGLKALSRLDLETRQQLATGSEQAVEEYLTDVAERSGQMGDDTFVEEDISEVQDYLSDVFHDPSINSWKDVLQQSRRMSEGNQEPELDEGWKSALGAAALAGTMAMGAGGAHARVMPGDDPGINRLTGKPIATQQATTDIAPARVDAPSGFSKEYLLKAADPDRFGRFMISIEKAQELLKQMNESNPREKEADYGDDYQDMVKRLKQLAGAGPLKTVWDPSKRVYRNVPTAEQPKR